MLENAYKVFNWFELVIKILVQVNSYAVATFVYHSPVLVPVTISVSRVLIAVCLRKAQFFLTEFSSIHTHLDLPSE